MCVCGWVTYRPTSRQRGWPRKTVRKKKIREWGRATETEQVSHSRFLLWATEGETRHVALPPLPLKTNLLLTDQKHNVSVSWTLICSGYFSKTSFFLLKLITRWEEKDRDRQQNRVLFCRSHLRDQRAVNVALFTEADAETHSSAFCVTGTLGDLHVDQAEILLNKQAFDAWALHFVLTINPTAPACNDILMLIYWRH